MAPSSALRRQVRLPGLPREPLGALLGYLALAAFFLRDAVFAGRVLFRRDINMVWLPQVEVFVRCLARGALPLWDPWSGFGRPLLADPRAEVLYPPTWLNLVLGPGPYYALFSLAHLALAGLGVFLLARRLGLGRLPAFVSGAVWLASGPLLSLVSTWHHLAGAAWIPWVLLAGEVALDRGTWRATLAWGAAIAAQVFAGSPDLSALTLLVQALAVAARRGTWRRWRLAAVALAFGVGLSAAQWLPTLEWAARSDRSSLSYQARTVWSLHPALLLEGLFPARFVELPLRQGLRTELLEDREPWLHSIHLGIPAFALALAGLLWRCPRRGWLFGVGAGAVLFALGPRTPLYDLLAFLLPPLRAFRFPVKAMVLASLCAALLAGGGLAVWTEAGRAGRRKVAILALLATLLLASLAGLHATTRGAEGWGALLIEPGSGAWRALAPARAASATAAAWATAALVLTLLCRRWPQATRAGMAVLAVGALALAHRNLHPTADPALFRQRPPALSVVEGEAWPRLYVRDYSQIGPRERPGDAAAAYHVARVPAGWGLPEALVLGVHQYLNPPTAARWGVAGSFDRDILDFDPVPLARLNDLLRARENEPTHLKVLRMGGVTHALALVPAPWWQDLEPVASFDGLFTLPIRLFRVPDPLPRAAVVAGARMADGDAALAAVVDPAFDPARELILPTGTPVPAADATGQARLLAVEPDRVLIEAEMQAPGHLLLLEAWDPGWRVRVDGRPAALLRADLVFRGVALPPGHHRVEMRYRPLSVAVGLALSVVAGVAWILLGWRARSEGAGGGTA